MDVRGNRLELSNPDARDFPIILFVVLYGCETWSLIRRIFGQKKNEMAGGWQKLHNKELHNFHSSPNIIRVIKSGRMRWVGHVVRSGETRIAYRTFVGKPEGKRPLRIPRRKWEDNIKTYLR
jgi:hypothetical protein